MLFVNTLFFVEFCLFLMNFAFIANNGDNLMIFDINFANIVDKCVNMEYIYNSCNSEGGNTHNNEKNGKIK